MPEPRQPKYRQIFEHVYDGILRGRYRPGSRIPTELELAAQFEASRMTVSRALRDLESEGFLLRRHGAGTFVRENGGRATGSVGLIFPGFPGFHSGIFDAMTLEITRRAQAAGYGLVLGDPLQGGVDAALGDPQKICEPYLVRRVACVFFTPVELPPEQMAGNARITDIFEEAGIPVILVDRDICDFPARSNHDLVGIDNFASAYNLAEHLLRQGYRELHFAATSAVAGTITARILGYQSAMIRHGILPDLKWVHRGDPQSPSFARELAEEAAGSAILCSNDHLAAILMRHFAPLGVRVPGDVAVVGFDDTPFAPLLAPPLTTVRQPGAELGAAAVRLMLERLADPRIPPREVRLPCELVVRESCGTPGHAQASAPATPRKSARRRP